MSQAIFPEGLKVVGDLQVGGAIKPPRPRSEQLQEDLVAYPTPLANCVVWDSGQPLPATAAADDLAHDPGTWGTSTPVLSAGDCKVATVTRRARITVTLPPEYVAGETVKLRIAAGMLTTVADGSCTVDVEAFLAGRNSLVSGSDLVTTSAQSINSLTFADKDFTVSSTALEPGDQLDVRVTIASVDSAAGTVVKPTIASIDLLCDIKG